MRIALLTTVFVISLALPTGNVAAQSTHQHLDSAKGYDPVSGVSYDGGHGPGNPCACNNDAECGEYILQINELIGEEPECPAGALAEGKPNCHDDYIDEHNPGCSGLPDPVFQVLEGAPRLPASQDVATITHTYPPGTYWFWVGPSVFSGVECGSLYVMSITGYQEQGPTPVEPATWGTVKRLFRP